MRYQQFGSSSPVPKSEGPGHPQLDKKLYETRATSQEAFTVRLLRGLRILLLRGEKADGRKHNR
jgi:hypothetical protein